MLYPDETFCLCNCNLLSKNSQGHRFVSSKSGSSGGRCMAFSCSRLSCMMHATSHKVHLRQAACAGRLTGSRRTTALTASLLQHPAAFALPRRHCRVVQQERSMAVGCAAAASGAQQTVSEKYERLDGVKVPTACNVVMGVMSSCSNCARSSACGIQLHRGHACRYGWCPIRSR